jgi:hypothetical protein
MRSPSKLFVALGSLLLSVRPAFPAEPAKPQGNLPACYAQLGIFADSNGPSAPAVPEGLGVNIHFTDARPGEMKLLAASGLRWVRMDFTWSRIEKAKGQYDFTAYDRLISTLEASHICPLFILDYGNPLYDGGLSPYTEEGREAFARWAATSAQRFKDRGVLWEIWNEPNGSFWRPKAKVEDYVKLALAVGRAIRDAVPQEIYIGPATAGIKFDFLEACFQAGLLDYWRAVSVHPYRQSDPETAQAEYKRLQDLIAKYAPGKAIPILSGEWGYSAAWKGMNEERQGKILPREWLTNMASNVPLSIWYDWHDDGENPTEPEHHFGMVSNPYDPAREQVYEPKPAYRAAKTLATVLNGFRFDRRLEVGSSDDYALVFKKDHDTRIVAWTTAAIPHPSVLPAGRGRFAVTSHLGSPLPALFADHQKLRIVLSDAPQYIVPANRTQLASER